MDYEQGIAALILFLYLCANNPLVNLLLKRNNVLQIIGSLIHLSSSKPIKVLSKALIARLIPTDAIKDDTAVLILVEDDEVDYLVNSLQTCGRIPIVMIMMDLSRSPHNMWALESKGVAIMLADNMEGLSENDQSLCAQLIWKLKELQYNGSEDVSVLNNNGTLQLQYEGIIMYFNDSLYLI